MRKLFSTCILITAVTFSASAQSQKGAKANVAAKGKAADTKKPAQKVATTDPASTFSDAVNKMEATQTQEKTKPTNTGSAAQPAQPAKIVRAKNKKG